MRRILYVLIAVVFASTAFIPLTVRDVYSHGVGESFNAHSVSVASEQVSADMVDTGGVIKIKGTLMSRVSDQEFRLSPYVSVDNGNPLSPLDLNSFPWLYYPLYDSTDSWYFRIESSLPNPIVLKPGENIDYEIRLYPLKAGIYHVHSYFIRNDGHDHVAAGQIVRVSGSTMPTTGEITQLYLPLALGGAVMALLVPKARKTAKELGSGRIRKGIRLYFIVKGSLETVWLTGLISWIVLTAYPVIQPFETRVASVIAMTAIIASLTVSSYIAGVSKSNKLNTVEIGTASASAIFYFLLLFGHSFQIDLSAGAFGYARNPLELNPLFLLVAIITNVTIAILALSKRKEAHRAGKSFSEITSKQ